MRLCSSCACAELSTLLSQDVLISKVQDSHATVRAKAVETLGSLVPVELGEAFPEASLKARQLLHDPSRFVRESAAKVLSEVCQHDNPSVLKDLVDASSDPDPAVRAAAITSLGVLASPGDSFVIDSIIKRTHDADSETIEVLQACFATLKQLEAEAILQQRGMGNRKAKKRVAEAEFKENVLEKARQFQNFLWEKAYKSQTAAWKKKEQKKQAKMVRLMLAAQREHLFDDEVLHPFVCLFSLAFAVHVPEYSGIQKTAIYLGCGSGSNRDPELGGRDGNVERASQGGSTKSAKSSVVSDPSCVFTWADSISRYLAEVRRLQQRKQALEEHLYGLLRLLIRA